MDLSHRVQVELMSCLSLLLLLKKSNQFSILQSKLRGLSISLQFISWVRRLEKLWQFALITFLRSSYGWCSFIVSGALLFFVFHMRGRNTAVHWDEKYTRSSLFRPTEDTCRECIYSNTTCVHVFFSLPAASSRTFDPSVTPCTGKCSSLSPLKCYWVSWWQNKFDWIICDPMNGKEESTFHPELTGRRGRALSAKFANSPLKWVHFVF